MSATSRHQEGREPCRRKDTIHQTLRQGNVAQFPLSLSTPDPRRGRAAWQDSLEELPPPALRATTTGVNNHRAAETPALEASAPSFCTALLPTGRRTSPSPAQPPGHPPKHRGCWQPSEWFDTSSRARAGRPGSMRSHPTLVPAGALRAPAKPGATSSSALLSKHGLCTGKTSRRPLPYARPQSAQPQRRGGFESNPPSACLCG